MASSVRPKRRVGKTEGIGEDDIKVDSAEADGGDALVKEALRAAAPCLPGAPSSPRALRSRPSGCSPRDRYQWPPECRNCYHRPGGVHAIGPVWARSQRCCRPRERSSGIQYRPLHRPKQLFRATHRQAQAHDLCAGQLSQVMPDTPPKDRRRATLWERSLIRRPSGSRPAQSNRLGSCAAQRLRTLPEHWLRERC